MPYYSSREGGGGQKGRGAGAVEEGVGGVGGVGKGEGGEEGGEGEGAGEEGGGGVVGTRSGNKKEGRLPLPRRCLGPSPQHLLLRLD